MAIATTLVFTTEDDKGKSSSTKVRVPSTFSISDYVEFAQAAAQLFANVLNARLTGVSINFGVDLSSAGLKSTVSGVATVATKIQGLFATASGLIAKWLIPAPLETLVTAGSDDFDQTDTDIAALVTANEDGIAVTGGTFVPTNGRGDVIGSVNTLKETFLRRSPS